MSKPHKGPSSKTLQLPPVVQGKLLHSRGDLSGYRINFLVELQQRPLNKPRHHAPHRLGLQVIADDDEDAPNGDALKVQNVPENGNWDTPVVWHNQEQKYTGKHLYTVQPGDWLTAVNKKNTGNAMLMEIANNTKPTDTADMNLQVERELRDILGPYKAPSRLSALNRGPRRSGREACKLDSICSPSHRNKSASTGGLDTMLRQTCCLGWRHGRAVPSGNMSSLAWGNFRSNVKISQLGNRLPDITSAQFQASEGLS